MCIRDSIYTNILETDTSTRVRAAAASALGKFVYLGEIEEIPEKTLRIIEDKMLDIYNSTEDTLVRRRALESLGFSARKEIPPLIESAYYSGDQDWLASALFAMSRSANERWIPLIDEMLDNDIPKIRFDAARAAGELEAKQCVPRLIELLGDEDDEIRMAAIWSLSQIGGEGIEEILNQLYEETDDDELSEFIETALDNLAFTNDIQSFSFLEIQEDELDDAVWEDKDFYDDIKDFPA